MAAKKTKGNAAVVNQGQVENARNEDETFLCQKSKGEDFCRLVEQNNKRNEGIKKS